MLEKMPDTPIVNKYLKDLQIPQEEFFAAKNILDLGAGNAMFAKEAEMLGKKVFSLDIDDSVWLPIQIQIINAVRFSLSSLVIEDWIKVLGRTVSADMGYLPFKNNCFDLIVCRYAFLDTLISADKMQQSLKETERVLQVGGRAYFFPYRDKTSRLVIHKA